MTKTIIRPIRITPELDTIIRDITRRYGYPSISALITEAIEQYLAERRYRNQSVNCNK